MQKNIGPIERAIRVLLGVGILSLAVVGPRTPWALLGIIPLTTGLVRWCPPYALLGLMARGPKE